MEKEKKVPRSHTSEYIYNYRQKKYRRYIALIKKEDKEMMKKLDSVDSINSYIYDLIKKDMELQEKNKIIQNGVLLMHTNGNWDYYLYNDQTYSIATDPQCKSCWFGGRYHFIKEYCLHLRGSGKLSNEGKKFIGKEFLKENEL
ncbi:hypothetical protein [Absicoccus intestinalis]|uniref:SWIM-type domain-containing protein n=1 Tax=Absicoccus intestinalis TaxID=2926319 RepID=A0ABU4WLF9_9FIRM|nr:hypothetical protein [Absicoccus sp. CLA-KB-P134]MDX8417378.1 hypothetical protein [Absicoccus sp. CLA-KB-P134]